MPDNNPPSEPPVPPPIDLEQLNKKLDRLLELLNRLRPPFRKIAGEDADGAIHLLHPDELAYIITKREDDARRGISPPSTPPASTPTDSDRVGGGGSLPMAGDDSLVIYALSGKTYRSFATISQLKTKLEDVPGMVVTHRSYLVNLNQVLQVKVTASGRDLTFPGVDLPAAVSKDNVSMVEDYLGIG
jgi:hypothetical protein